MPGAETTMTPLDVSEADITLIRATLDAVPMRGHVECLEWGSGGSTLMFPTHLENHSRPYRWLSLENNEGWYDRVRQAVVNLKVDVRLIPSMDAYISFPFSMHRRYDFIFVDGRCRRRCLITASKLLAVGGVVVLHDAERTHYHCAFSHYSRHERIGDKLWRGWIDV